MTAAGRVNGGIVIIGLDPRNLRNIDDKIRTHGTDYEPARRIDTRLLDGAEVVAVRQQHRETTRKLKRFVRTEPIACPRESVSKACFVYWLHEVIERVGLESPNSKSVIGSYEDHRRQAFGWNAPKNCKAINFGHLNIEKDQVGRQQSNQPDGFLAIASFAANFKVVMCSEQVANTTASDRLVVNDHHADASTIHLFPYGKGS